MAGLESRKGSRKVPMDRGLCDESLNAATDWIMVKAVHSQAMLGWRHQPRRRLIMKIGVCGGDQNNGVWELCRDLGAGA